LVCSQITSNNGTFFLAFSCGLKLKIDTSCASNSMVNIPLRQLMRVSLRGPYPSGLGRKFGRPGPRPSVDSSCGLLRITDVGQQIVWCVVVSLTWSDVLCVIKHLRRSTISLLVAPLQENSGTVSSLKWAYNPYLLSLQMLPFMIGGRGSAVKTIVWFYKESILL
jgi:hypothetical protein